MTENGDTIKTKYYSRNHEKEITGSVVRELHYLYSPYGLIGVMIKQGTTENIYYAETDQLGSIISLLNSDGTYAEKYLYDAWGRRRNPSNIFLCVKGILLSRRDFISVERITSGLQSAVRYDIIN